MSTVRMNISLPEALANALRKEIPRRQISQVIAKATEDELALRRRLRAMEELRKLGPAFPHIKDAAKYVHDMRRKDMSLRDKKLGLL